MRLTLKDRPLIDASGLSGQPPGVDWWLLDLQGWGDAPAPRAASDLIPDGHGGYAPSRFLMSPRTLAVKGAHVARSSSLARAEAEDWVASLDGEFPVIVEDAHGVREVVGFQSARPSYRLMGEDTTIWTVYVTAPDPIKYGPVVPFTGGFVENAGREAVLPWRIVTTGSATSILVVLDGHRIRWTGAASNVVIDTRSGTATATSGDVTVGLVEDDVPLLAPGRTSMTVTTDAASVVVEVRPGWR